MEAVTTPADELHIDRRAPVERIPLAPSSWVDFVPGFVRDAAAELSELHESLAWQQTEVLRYDKYVPENRLGVGVRNDAHPLLRADRPAPSLSVSGAVHRRRGDPLSRRAATSRALHSDREMRWLDDTVIAIVVLGARRPFVLRPAARARCAGRARAGGNRAGRRDPHAGGGRHAW